MTCLPDINVWVALAVAEHVHHQVARRWFEASVHDMVAFCRVTQMGFLRLLTNPHVMAGDALTAGRAWNLLDAFCEDTRITFSPEPPGLEASWRAWTQQQRRGPNYWTDAYLGAFASTAGHTLVTFDRGFTRFQGIRLRLLATP
jgi:uncharacterized protein